MLFSVHSTVTFADTGDDRLFWSELFFFFFTMIKTDLKAYLYLACSTDGQHEKVCCQKHIFLKG